MSFDVEVKNKLIVESLVTSTTFFSGPKAVIPESGGPYVLFMSTGGGPNELTQDDVVGYATPSGQISVIADVASVGKAKAEAIRTSLMSVRNTTLSGVAYRQITADQQVFDAGLDVKARPVSQFNISAIKRPS